MALKGVMNKIAWVDLSTGEVNIETPEDDVYLRYIGGYGIGAYYLFKRQPAGVDPLGPQAIIGFTTGVLTGTDAICGNRFTVVGKSPKTGGWGDANCGGPAITPDPSAKPAGRTDLRSRLRGRGPGPRFPRPYDPRRRYTGTAHRRR